MPRVPFTRDLLTRDPFTCVPFTGVPAGADRDPDEGGQSTAEYALLLLGVAAVALALLTWAAGGKVASFFDTIFDHLIQSVR